MGMYLLILQSALLFPLENALPYITPNGYNASLSSDKPVEFKCIVANNSISFVWYINGTSTSLHGQRTLADQGIIYSRTFLRGDNMYYVNISVEPRVENDNTTLKCTYYSPDLSGTTSDEVVVRFQGHLAPPTALETAPLNLTHDMLTWKDPYTLDLTDIDPDITGYTITVAMENPLPVYPYNHSVTLELLTDISIQKYFISSTAGQKFTFPRYTFPVWFSVSADNLVGLGEMSLYFKYFAKQHHNCMRIIDRTSHFPVNRVVFNNSTPLVEIFLFHFSFQSNITYCFDTVEVNVTTSDGGVSVSHVLLPTLSDTGVSIILESGLEKNAHFTATLLHESQLIATTNFSTYVIQDVSISISYNGALTVQCQFAEGYTDDTCTVILVLNGMKYRMEMFTGEMIFYDLDIGLYTILVYDSETSKGLPAVQRVVNITTTTAIEMSTDSTTVLTDNRYDNSSITLSTSTTIEVSTDSTTVLTASILLSIATSIGCLLLCILIGVLIISGVLIMKRYFGRKGKFDDATPTTTICSEPNSTYAAVAHHINTEQNSAYAEVPHITTEQNSAYAEVPHINTEQNSAYTVLRDIDIASHINTEKNVAYSLLTPQSNTTTQNISSSLALYEEIQL